MFGLGNVNLYIAAAAASEFGGRRALQNRNIKMLTDKRRGHPANWKRGTGIWETTTTRMPVNISMPIREKRNKQRHTGAEIVECSETHQRSLLYYILLCTILFYSITAVCR